MPSREEEEEPTQKTLEGEAAEEQDESQTKLSEYRSQPPGRQGELSEHGSLIERAKYRARQIGIEAGKRARIATQRATEKAVQGFRKGRAETVKHVEGAIHEAGRQTGRIPLTIATGAYGAAEKQVNIAKQAYHNRHVGVSVGMPFVRSPRVPRAVKVKGVRFQAPGRIAKFKVPRHVIPNYWSAKLKKIARYEIRRHGVDAGLSKTREIARIAGFKIQ